AATANGPTSSSRWTRHGRRRSCWPTRSWSSNSDAARRGGVCEARCRALLRDHDDVLGLRALLALAGLVLHLRALGQRLEAGARDAGVVDEEVLRALVGRDEAVPLRVVEPLDGAGCHENTSLTQFHERVRKARKNATTLALNCRAVYLPCCDAKR